ncbi:MAG: hypothetical protein IJI36_08275 [Kiritimatiellae bacterium]|nr:hypothetical protein [Kiritimatiellia bacterium]
MYRQYPYYRNGIHILWQQNPYEWANGNTKAHRNKHRRYDSKHCRICQIFQTLADRLAFSIFIRHLNMKDLTYRIDKLQSK